MTRTALWALALGLGLTGSLAAQETYIDDFDRPDGPDTGWTVVSGDWQLFDGFLDVTGAGGENWAWAGDPPFTKDGDFSAAIDIEFGPAPGDGVGRHGGFMFLASVPATRGDPAMNGYTIDWIDREADHGLRLLRWDNGAQSDLSVGTPDLIDPPLEWGIEVSGELITILADGEVVMEVADDTYRRGHFGAWAWGNATQLLIDRVEIEYTPLLISPCLTASQLTGPAPLTVDFDASCTTSVNDIAAYRWDFGDGENATGAQVSHEFLIADTYVVSLEVEDSEGNLSTTETTVGAFDQVDDFEDDFGGGDGPPTGWTVAQGEWSILGGELVGEAIGQEAWIWAGEPASIFPDTYTVTFDCFFPTVPGDGVGRHGGVMFCATEATQRYDGAMGGYTIDWIDRAADHGFRLLRVDGGGQTSLAAGGADIVEPPEEWQVEVTPGSLRFFADGDFIFETNDTTYRGGFFGAWAFQNGTVIAIDNVRLGVPALSACFTTTPGTSVAAGTEVTFDASCSIAGAGATYRWDLGDGTNAVGESIAHTYEFAGVYTVSLEVETAEGETETTESTIEAYEVFDSFEDDFDRADGDVDNWTVVGGTWSIFDGALSADVPGPPEAWIWAGDPAARFEGVDHFEFEFLFDNTPGDAVGRHAGVFFFAQNTSPRFGGNSGYSIDWIDRPADHGYRFIRWDNGAATDATVVGVEDFDPGEVWEIDADESFIRLTVDGELKGEFFDVNYRSGFFGFWSYFNGQLISIDDVVVGEAGPPPVGTPFIRGDADNSLAINITDGIFVLNFLFLGGPPPPCAAAGDADASGGINITDGIFILNFLFLGGPPPSAPYPDCGVLEGADCAESACP